jgi:GT2 family glycosyltransferase
MMKDLSIVIPTCRRAVLLEQCLDSIERGTHCDYEVVVVDGASTDGTPAVLKAASGRLRERLVVIREEQREGFTKAINKGFRAAAGRCLAWLNDDARPTAGSFDQALQQMNSAKADVGLLALFHAWNGTRSVAYETRVAGRVYRILHLHGTLIANFGLGRRETFASLGYFDEQFFIYGADPDFSLKVWNAGMKVEPAYMTAIDHDEHLDARRDADADAGARDTQRLFAKWNLPEGNAARNDFDPAHPCTLRGRRDQAAAG